MEMREAAGIVVPDNEWAFHRSSDEVLSSHTTISDPGHRLEQPPSALEFSRKVGNNRPVVIQGVPQKHFPRAWEKWKSSEYLRKQMASPSTAEGSEQGPRKVIVALTPNGRLNDVVKAPDDWRQRVIVAPHKEPMYVSSNARARLILTLTMRPSTGHSKSSSKRLTHGKLTRRLLSRTCRQKTPISQQTGKRVVFRPCLQTYSGQIPTTGLSAPISTGQVTRWDRPRRAVLSGSGHLKPLHRWTFTAARASSRSSGEG